MYFYKAFSVLALVKLVTATNTFGLVAVNENARNLQHQIRVKDNSLVIDYGSFEDNSLEAEIKEDGSLNTKHGKIAPHPAGHLAITQTNFENVKGFTIEDDLLKLHGSSKFFACPRTDNEYTYNVVRIEGDHVCPGGYRLQLFSVSKDEPILGFEKRLERRWSESEDDDDCTKSSEVVATTTKEEDCDESATTWFATTQSWETEVPSTSWEETFESVTTAAPASTWASNSTLYSSTSAGTSFATSSEPPTVAETSEAASSTVYTSTTTVTSIYKTVTSTIINCETSIGGNISTESFESSVFPTPTTLSTLAQSSSVSESSEAPTTGSLTTTETFSSEVGNYSTPLTSTTIASSFSSIVPVSSTINSKSTFLSSLVTESHSIVTKTSQYVIIPTSSSALNSSEWISTSEYESSFEWIPSSTEWSLENPSITEEECDTATKTYNHTFTTDEGWESTIDPSIPKPALDHDHESTEQNHIPVPTSTSEEDCDESTKTVAPTVRGV
ncbi:hypothetical protein PACTADRAFT_3433 [Pachysolen tannophilus NRRL Y-2460]|uniref:Flo11 domain-containing protein n=1 Tax=Pachysolen tannophilus NRRL Y-2460 TaxID=669874 RepID=A0A1E4TS96_PACTA|nr:hypothetical protein PACTADRAFT_3433 [Pachysolen tannophilus NRRL Y-2460]